MSDVPQAELKETEHGLVPWSEGWYVLNARDARWVKSAERGEDTDLEGKANHAGIGFRIQVLGPGQRGMYHRESGQEDFLVLSGECILLLEGEERRLTAWDFVHCPPWTEHTFVGVSESPCVIAMAGSRAQGFEVVYPVNELAAKYGACVEQETTSPEEAYAAWSEEQVTRYEEGWLP